MRESARREYRWALGDKKTVLDLLEKAYDDRSGDLSG
jgi:hypothetical protein